jgi:ubiquitin C-terminal hydrolase
MLRTLFFQQGQGDEGKCAVTGAGRRNFPHFRNTCFMTVVFQLLFAVPGFLRSGGRVILRLKKMLTACQLPSDGLFSCYHAAASLLEFHLTESRVMLSLGKVRLFPLGEQGDPFLFLESLLSQEGMTENFRELFQNEFKTDTGCRTCNHQSKNYFRKTFFISLHLEKSKELVSLQDILSAQLEKQDCDDAVICPSCDKKDASMWRQTIVNPAKVLVLELKRAHTSVCYNQINVY